MDIYAIMALFALISSVWLPNEIVDLLIVSFYKLLETHGFDLHSVNKLREVFKQEQKLDIYVSKIKGVSTLS